MSDYRKSLGRDPETTFGIVDAQSVKNTDTAENKGYDAGKKISGIKRHLCVDILGLPHAVDVSTANLSDRDGALDLFTNWGSNLSNLLNCLFDGGYRGEKFASAVHQILGCRTEVVKRNELHEFKVLPKRWVVERSFGWLEKCRRLWKNCERKLSSSRSMVLLAFIVIVLKRF